MPRTFPVGSTARLYLTLISYGMGRTGQSPTIAIQRVADGRWLDAATGRFETAYAEGTMLEVDPVHLPGRYAFDFDHALDETVSPRFIAKMQNGVASPEVSYEDLYFGPPPAVVEPRLCSIQGSLFGADGRPLQGALVQATLLPLYTDALGRGYEADSIVKAFTGHDGAFDLPVVQGANIRLEIRAIGYDRRVLVPSFPSILFTKL